ncbi:MAG: RagB/SusD family nutrient uptake outer membrane protein [Bacteroidota bacterium]
MKKYIKLIAATYLLWFCASCSEEFLEIAPSDALPPAEALRTVNDMRTVLLGVYSQLQNSDYYGRYFILVPDVMSDDVKQNASANRASEWAEYNGNDLDFIPEEIWTEVYEAINRANTIINAKIDINESTQALADQYLGEAYTLRALGHFDLVRIYAQHYQFSAGANHLGVPIVTAFDQNAEPARASVAEVYAAVVSDLTTAISLLNQDRGKGFVSPAAANAILSRVYLYMDDMQKAAEFATKAIDDPNTDLTSGDAYLGTWMNNSFSPDAIFDVVMTEADNLGGDALGRMYINEGYGDYLPAEDLLNLLDTMDVRSQLFKEDETIGGVYGSLRMNKFPSITGEDHTPVIRLAEMYLIRAEARAKLGDEAGAIEDLMTIRSRAWASAPEVTASGQELLDEIALEKRRELMFEGHRLWELMRHQQSVIRTDCTAPVCEITYPNDRFVLPIPQQELNANPNIEQNEGY